MAPSGPGEGSLSLKEGPPRVSISHPINPDTPSQDLRRLVLIRSREYESGALALYRVVRLVRGG